MKKTTRKKTVKKAASKKAAAKHLEKDFKNLTLVEMNAKEMAIVCNALALSSEPGAKQLLSDFKKQKIK